jgi:soluble lytic murein transglycosylase-like protein
VIQRESDYRAGARNGPYYGLMQILPQTARTMGYEGPDSGLLDAETNLQYAGRYLRGAWLVSGGDEDKAIMWYARGYYYEAKRLGLLVETGLRAG